MKSWIKRNGLDYALLMETEEAHLYEVNNGTSYEVAVLVKVTGNQYRDAGLYLPSNEQFGSHGNRSKVFYNKATAIKYFKKIIK